MFVTENDIRRIVNKEISPELAERRARTLEQSKGALKRLVPGVLLKPGVIISMEDYEAMQEGRKVVPEDK
ncbi:hypothetical protein DVJ83_15335 (plasmid) [Deinococcus wulumuqiensis]|uniref:Uncharacterized protein n=1 Tax=Deinococcus wulumuqiensis TaxID=980427 RepID=A0A345ILH7_9DEIO|nr:hypothetical protein [Deinococcus wulumuqiensis]AXH00550.1 hypothetical protein DVJ83_15335 [Deinococcus wulumuqiensis]